MKDRYLIYSVIIPALFLGLIGYFSVTDNDQTAMLFALLFYFYSLDIKDDKNLTNKSKDKC